MSEEFRWRSMVTAPKDGTNVLVTIAASEQGPALVDVAYWGPADDHDPEGWRSAEPGVAVAYADPEVLCWLPVAEDTARPAAWSGDEEGLDGGGI